MSLVRTNLRNTRERADQIRFYPAATVSATNVQKAIEEVESDAIAAATSPPAITPTSVNFAMSPYTILPTDYLILVDTSGGAVTLQAGAASARGSREVTIKDSTGNAAANNISILRAGADTIDGLTTYPIASNFGAAMLSPVTGGYAVT
jgi:hypothetical protein